MIRAVRPRWIVTVLVVASGVAASAQRAPQLVLSQLTWFTRAGATLGKVGPLADHGNFELSPDGSKVAVAVMDQSKGTRDIWMYETATGARSRFTTDAAEENWMIWSPNGQRVTLNRFVPGLSRLLESPVSAAMPEEMLQLGEGGVWPVSWSPDGRAILYVTNSRETSNDIWVLPVGGAKPYPFQQTPASENWAAFSPDGRWVAFSSTASSDIPEVFVTRFPGGGQAWRISADGGSQARWRRDGKGGGAALHRDVSLRRLSRVRRVARRRPVPRQHGDRRQRSHATGAPGAQPATATDLTMPHPLTAAMRPAILAILLVSWAAPATAQAPYASPRTPRGHPDLQGVWTSDDARTVPVQRPPELGEKASPTDAEFAARKRRDDDTRGLPAPPLARPNDSEILPRDPSFGRPQ